MSVTGELLAHSQLLGEMIAEGLVERDHEAVVCRQGGRTYMVELRMLDVTESEKEQQ